MYKAYKFRLYPDNNQREKINKNFGCNRFVYNYYLDKIVNVNLFCRFSVKNFVGFW